MMYSELKRRLKKIDDNFDVFPTRRGLCSVSYHGLKRDRDMSGHLCTVPIEVLPEPRADYKDPASGARHRSVWDVYLFLRRKGLILSERERSMLLYGHY